MKWRNLSRLTVIAMLSLLAVGADPATGPRENPATSPADTPATVPADTPATAPTDEPSTRSTTTTTRPAASAPAALSIDHARARYLAALRKGREQYFRDLVELKRKALRADNLALANQVDEQIRLIAHDPGATGKTTKVIVRADQDWQRSTVLVRAGERLQLTASGQWVTNLNYPGLTTYGPDGLQRDGAAEGHGMWSILWARIGHKLYFVGKTIQITVEDDGVIEFRSNDFSLGDNRGAINVQVTKSVEEQ